MMKIIYQIGRFDNLKEALKEFFISKFNDEDVAFSKSSELSSFVLKDFLKERGEKAKAIIIYPVSIVLNENLKKGIEDDSLKKELDEIYKDPSAYLKSPFEMIAKLPLERHRDEMIVIHSLGTYLEKNEVRLDGIKSNFLCKIPSG